MAIQFLLNAKGCSGRGVRLRDIDPDMRDRISVDTAKLVGKDATVAEYGVAEARQLVVASISAVTKGAVKDADALVALPESEWIPLDPQKLDADPTSATHYRNLFSAKEDSVISGIVRRVNTATADEVEAIMGKAIPLSLP